MGAGVGVGHGREDAASLAAAPGAVPDQVLIRLALVAFETVAVCPHWVETTARAHAARAVLALALSLALTEPYEDVGELGILKVGKEDAAMVLATALALSLCPDRPAYMARRLERIVAPT